MQKLNSANIINWGALSRFLSGSRQTVRKNKIPKCHQPVVNELLTKIERVLSKLPDKAAARGQKIKPCTDDSTSE